MEIDSNSPEWLVKEEISRLFKRLLKLEGEIRSNPEFEKLMRAMCSENIWMAEESVRTVEKLVKEKKLNTEDAIQTFLQISPSLSSSSALSSLLATIFSLTSTATEHTSLSKHPLVTILRNRPDSFSQILFLLSSASSLSFFLPVITEVLLEPSLSSSTTKNENILMKQTLHSTLCRISNSSTEILSILTPFLAFYHNDAPSSLSFLCNAFGEIIQCIR